MKIEDRLNVGLLDDISGLQEYANIPHTIASVVSAKMATLHECDTIYSAEDVYLMLEVISIDAHNRRVAQEHFKRLADRR